MSELGDVFCQHPKTGKILTQLPYWRPRKWCPTSINTHDVLLKESVLRSLDRKSCLTRLMPRYLSCYEGPPTTAKSTELPPRSHAATKGLFSYKHTAVNVFRHENSLLTFLNLLVGFFPFFFFRLSGRASWRGRHIPGRIPCE